MKELAWLRWLFIFQFVHKSTHCPDWVTRNPAQLFIFYSSSYTKTCSFPTVFPQLAVLKISVRYNPLSPDRIILETPNFSYTEVISILLSMRVISFHSLDLYPVQKIRNFHSCFPEEPLTRLIETTLEVIMSDDNCHKSSGNTLTYTTYFQVILKGSQSCLMIP